MGFKVDGRRLKSCWHWSCGCPLASCGAEATIRRFDSHAKPVKWYAVLPATWLPEPLPATGVDVGIDVGLTSLITTSEGEHVEHPAWYRRAQKRVRVAQRRVARREGGCQSAQGRRGPATGT